MRRKGSAEVFISVALSLLLFLIIMPTNSTTVKEVMAENVVCSCKQVSDKQMDMLENPDKYIVKPEPEEVNEQSESRSVPATGSTTE